MVDQVFTPVGAGFQPSGYTGPGLGTFEIPPSFNYGMTFKELGQSGLRAFNGWVREDFLPQLQGRQAQTVYREMADNSSTVGGLLFAINATMGKVAWRVVPASDDGEGQEMADFAESLMDDMEEMTWNDVIQEGLSMLPFGYAPLEINYKKRDGMDTGDDANRPGRRLPQSKFDDGRIGWRSLPLRGQDTVLKWFLDPHGEILGLTQQPYVGPLLNVPAEKFLLFRPTQHKNNPEGRSILRNAYRDYLFVKRLEEQEGILFERMNGIPVLRVPGELMQKAEAGDAGATATLQAFKNIAINLRIDEQMGLVLPSDVYESATGGGGTAPMYGFDLVAPGKGTGTVDQDKSIVRHQTGMMMSVLADFLTLGHGKTGTQALAVAKQDMFFQAVEGYLNRMAATINRQGLTRLWALNGLDYDKMPEIQPDLAQRVDLDVLSNFILRLSQSGMPLFPDVDLESALKDAAGLPDIAQTASGDIIADYMQDQQQRPMPIVGPGAAMLMPKPDPAPDPNSPIGKALRMVAGSYARRRAQMGGINIDKAVRLRKRRLPRPEDGAQGALF